MVNRDRVIERLREVRNLDDGRGNRKFRYEWVNEGWIPVYSIESDSYIFCDIRTFVYCCNYLGLDYEYQEEVVERHWLLKLLFNAKPIVIKSILVKF